jgi:SAM-dependent MidA family methyltransferase
MTLERRLEALISATGPMTVADYMTACLHHPELGYYATRPRLGESGDFITAPLISQMFGELIGLWAAATWMRMGCPSPFRLVEMGPGDGTLMGDLLRAGRAAPGFLDAAELWLVETSAPLKAAQAERLSGHRPSWAANLAEVPGDAPLILVSNELLDCLPTRQFVRTEQGWAERRVGLVEGRLGFGLAPPPSGFKPPEAPAGALVEQSDAVVALGDEVGKRIACEGGAALFIDYGPAEPGFGDTLQALIAHEKVSPLHRPGEADLTVHADFPAFAAAARGAGAGATAIVEQGEFLRRLGIEQRAAALAAARPDKAGTIGRQLARLVEPDQMGSLFKAVAIHAPGLELPGFE